MYEISFLVGLKNNLEYSKKFYQHFRDIYPDEQLVFVSFGSSDGTHEWLESLIDKNVRLFYEPNSKTLSDTYNKAIEISTKNHVRFLHNDMVLGKNFVKEIQKALQINPLIYYKTVEPPIFEDDNRLWKEIQDFGNDFDDFKYNDFFKFEELNKNKENLFVENSSFFLAAEKALLTNINGLDPLFNPMFCEDDDLILRLKLSGQKPLLSLSAIVYHFVSKTSRFSEEYQNISKKLEENSHRNFYRKWGFRNDSLHRNKRTYGLILENSTEDSLKLLEPFVSHIYTNDEVIKYVEKEQEKTAVDLTEKFRKTSDPIADDVVLKFDADKISEKNINIFRNLNDIIIARKTNKRKYKFLDFIFPVSSNNFKVRDVHFKILKENLLEKQLIVRKNV